MGNSTSEIVSRVSEMSYEQAKKLLNQDLELLHDTSIVFSPAKLAVRGDLATYKVGSDAAKKPEAITSEDEQALIYSQLNESSAKDRNEQAVKTLMKDISQATDIDVASAEISKKLQAFCRVFEAILRIEECKKKKPSELGGAQASDQLPPAAKTAIKFGLTTLLNLIECVAELHPSLFDYFLNDANFALADCSPLSLSTSDPTLRESFERITSFFDSIVSGQIRVLSTTPTSSSLLPYFKLSLVSGNVSSLLQFSKRLLQLSDLSQELRKEFFPLLKAFNGVPIGSNLNSWSTSIKGDNVQVSELVVRGSAENDNGNVFASFEYAHSFYFEIRAKKTNENCYFGVCDAAFKEKATWNDANLITVTYCSNSAVFSKAAEVFKFEPWAAGDRIGVFVDSSKKTVTFYKNGEKQKADPIKIKSEKVKIFALISKASEIEMINGIDYPLDLQETFILTKHSNSPFQDLLLQDSPSEEYLSQPLCETLAFILKKLADGLIPVEHLFSLRNFKFESKNPTFSFQLSASTFNHLQDMQNLLYSVINSADFSVISETAAKSATYSIQRLLMFHLLLSEQLEDSSLNEEIKRKILEQTISFIQTSKHAELSNEAMKMLGSCFELFYRDPTVKLEYINKALERGEVKQIEVFEELEAKIFQNIARPDKMFPILDNINEYHLSEVQKFYKQLITKAEKVSEAIITGENSNRSVIKLLSSAQAALFSHAGKAEFKGKFLEIIYEYSTQFLQSALATLKSAHEFLQTHQSEEIALAASNSLIGTILEELLNSLILCPLDSTAISEILPVITELSTRFSGIPAFESVLSVGIGIVEDIYESAHNYPDSANLTHTVKVPCAIKYSLEFDPQCKTENGCDYLELWLDETASNKFARWEGTSFPTEPVEVVNPILHFTFRSDGSVNYWGWKIVIKAMVETSYYKKQWPENTKDTIELFLGKCATKMVNGDFEGYKIPDDVKSVLSNPLFQYGISDLSLAYVSKLPTINTNLNKIGSHILKPADYLVSPPLRPFSYLPDYEVGLKEYLEYYNSITNTSFASNSFLVEFVEGSEALNSTFAALKKKSGVVGGTFSIGGSELDQAERGIFAVYSSFFEITDTVKQILTGENEAGPTVKIIVKESCQIRSWAQKHKQRLFDSGKNEVTYQSISDDIVKKCAILLGSDYKSALNQIGISKLMKNLVSNIAKGQKAALKLNSKWKHVQGAFKSATKLNALISINKKSTKPPNEDLKEFYRVVELVKKFLEAPVAVEAILEALSSRRSKAIIRSMGYLSISKLISYSATEHETFIVKAFSDSMKTLDSKLHYLDGIEAVDPLLMKSVQKGFFLALRSIQEDIIAAANCEFTYELYSHFTSAIEALSWKFRGEDLHLLESQPITALIRTLLKWARADFTQKPVQGKFNVEKCVTRIGVLTEEAVPEGKTKILIEKIEGQPAVYLVLDFGGKELPITQFVISEEVKEGLEEATPEFVHQGVNKKVYVYRSEAEGGKEFLVGVGEDLQGKFEKYVDLLGEPNAEELKKLEKLKMGLAKNAWNLYKQLIYSFVGSWHGSSETTHLIIQEKCLRVIFDELKTGVLVQGESEMKVKELVTAENWLGNGKVINEKSKCAMDVWLNEFSKAPQIEIAELINTFAAYIDPLSKGAVELADCEHLQPVVDKYKDADGKIEFFSFLSHIKATVSDSESLSSVKTAIENNTHWNEWPKEQHPVDYSNIEGVIQALENLYVPSAEPQFGVYLEHFKGSNGIFEASKLKGAAAAEFLTDSNVDLYKTLTEIKKNSKFAGMLSEISGIYSAYPNLPASLLELTQRKKATNDYSASLLLTLYSAFTSDYLPKAVSHDHYLKHLVSYLATPTTIALYTLSSRILSKVLATQHSPQTFSSTWQSLSSFSSHPNLFSFLFNQIGKSLHYTEDRRFGYESRNLLNSLIQSPRWKESVIEALSHALKSAVHSLETGEVLDCSQIGALLFLSNNFYVAKVPFPFAVVSLKESSFSWGVVKEVLADGKFLVYSVIDDSSAQVELSNVVSVDNVGGESVFKAVGEVGLVICDYLLEIWKGISQSFNRPLKAGGEGFVVFTVMYKALQNIVLTTLIDALDLLHLDTEKLSQLVKELIEIRPARESITTVDYTNAAKQIQSRTQALMEPEKELTAEELVEQVNLLDEESKAAVKVFEEAGVSALFAYKCVKSGIKDPNSVNSYESKVQTTLLYKLSSMNEDAFAIQDVEGHGEVYQNNQYHIVIADHTHSHKSIEFVLSNKIFDPVKFYTTDLTIRLALETISLEERFQAGVKIGNLDIKVNSGSVQVDDKSIVSPVDQILLFRINANSSGVIGLCLENTGETVEVFDRSVFTGFSVGKIHLYMNEGSLISLSMLEVHNQIVTTNFTGKVEKTSKSDSNERFVKIKIRTPDSMLTRLKLLGISEEQVEQVRKSTNSLSEAVEYSFNTLTPRIHPEALKKNLEVITELKIFETEDQVPHDFIKVKIFENWKEIDFKVADRKILAYKQGVSENNLLGFSIGEAAEHQAIGELNLPSDSRSYPLYAKFGKTSPKDIAINSIILIKSHSVYNVSVPRNYTVLTDKEGKAVNLSPKSEKAYYLFIAIKKTVEYLSVPIQKLESILPKFTTFGLVDSSKSSSGKKQTPTDFSSFSLTSLYSFIYTYELNTLHQLSETLILKSLQKSTEYFKAFTSHMPLNRIFAYLDLNFVKTFNFAEPDSKSLGLALIQESIVSLISVLVPKTSSGRVLKSVHVESTHPYDNNMDVDDVISIPGATSLRIEFDPQCYTESGCDPLRFYESSGRAGELKCFSGQGEAVWANFEVPGDTVYTYFHSDGSVNYWGYKFEVIPLGGCGSGEKDNYLIALEILKKAAKDAEFSKIVQSDHVLCPLFGFLLGSVNAEEKLSVLDVVKDVAAGLGTENGKALVEYLGQCAELLYKSTSNDKVSHNVLQALVQILFECKKVGGSSLTSDWFLDLADLLSDMSGLGEKGKSLELFLFDICKGTVGSKLEVEFESEHPYLVKTQSKELKVLGAHSLKIEFSADSKAEKEHSVFFSKQEHVAQNALQGLSTSSLQAKWSHKGPDIEFSEDNFRVTRTNSSSWGGALIGLKLTSGITSFTYLIENDGGSDYLYIGFIEADDFPEIDLSACYNNDYAKNHWTWKKTGDVFAKGFQSSATAFATGDLIKFTVNFEKSSIVLFKNTVAVYTFNDIGKSVIPVVSFGGSNQFVVLKSIETTNDNSLESKKVTILGESTFLWFPVNYGYFNSYSWDFNPNESCSITTDHLTLNKLTDDVVQVPILQKFEKGKHYFQVRLSKGKNFEIGVAPTNEIAEKNWNSDRNAKYKEVREVIVVEEKKQDSENAEKKVEEAEKEKTEATPTSETPEILIDTEKTEENKEEVVAVPPTAEGSEKKTVSETKVEEGGFADGDLVGVLLDFDSKLIQFYRNKKLVTTVTDKLQEGSYGIFGVIKTKDTSVAIVNEEPSWLDILHVDTERVSQEFGYKLKVIPEFKGRSQEAVENFLASSSQEFKDTWEAYRTTYTSIFRSGAAEEMVMFIDAYSTTKSKDPTTLVAEDFTIPKTDLIYYPELEKLDPSTFFKLYQILQNFNVRIKNSIYLFDLNFKSTLTDLQKFLLSSRSFIFFDTKNKLLKAILEKTKNDQRTEITIDRPKAARYRNKKLVDTDGQFSIFGQIFRAMSAVANTGYRNSERIYKVNYRGEGSIDAGGPYNESMSNMCDELMSSFLRLLLPTSNNTNNMGEYRDAWLLNPSATSQIDLDLYKFLGKLMGAAIRTQNNLNLSLPPLFWRTLLRERLTVKDLRTADACVVQILEILKNPEAHELTSENFDSVYDEKFVTKDSSGKEVELVKGGRDVQVTFANCAEYADLVVKVRLSEGELGYESLREGLSAVVPVDYLNLMSYKQLETLVCGAADVDIDILKENTDYEGCSVSDQHIGYFWEVLKAFNAKQRTLFLKFVWGRTRLPAGKDWRHMKVTRLQPAGPVNNYMPVSHTCFFTLDLPAYTTKEAMEQKVLYAITHCTAIDLDGRAGQGWEDND